ncbi:S-adenosyl-L-methionine-dependent methyltransferase [Lindgomyces ingoldianus]|uniref:S-adenosyl-L-methionine-dependent methyltransferase n=1 Tax=Lindgomyces ingoldianus TaxID=673940 RepID=A0ACB6QQ23_9PLEO|nr:S-adenosyl-L-methionine-dependent methyltransferase [Lindgomyces ingoldianus]KAF2469089.1 S-adenosyl-L-methionine-dependent methyltransferase [Lindgomyces ingoldianus]
MASESSTEKFPSTQNTQYDKIGTKYNYMHELPAVQPEKPSVVAAVGGIKGLRCLDLACGTGRYTHLLHTLGASSVHGYDISSTMISGAKTTYPPSSYPALHFAVADCSKPLDPKPEPFDLIFAGWFLNYAGTQEELVSMFRVIGENLKPDGRFVGITTNVNDPKMKEPKMDFYGLDILVLDPEYKEPGGSGEDLGITARVVAHTEFAIQFDVFQFKKDVYERCAAKAGLRLKWSDPVVPDDERMATQYWARWLERPTFVVVEAVRT